jgi:hypothetical protein
MECACCGTPLRNDNKKGASKKKYKLGYLPICLDCQQKKYTEIKKYVESDMMALYITCMMFDTPCYIELAKEMFQDEDIAEEWMTYLKILKDKQKNKDMLGDFYSFSDGDAYMEEVFAEENDEQEAENKWGMMFDDEGFERKFSQRELQELDNLYREQAAEYKGAITPRVDMSLREICICRLEWKKRVGMGDSQGAKRYMDMIKDAMAREGMRAIDSKPLEQMRIDSIIDNLEKKGYVENGKIVGKRKLLNLLAKDHPKYHTSLDVVDAIMMQIVNTMRKNNGDAELSELPVEAQVDDVFGELMPMPTKEEKKNLEETGVMIPRRAKR